MPSVVLKLSSLFAPETYSPYFPLLGGIFFFSQPILLTLTTLLQSLNIGTVQGSIVKYVVGCFCSLI